MTKVSNPKALKSERSLSLNLEAG